VNAEIRLYSHLFTDENTAKLEDFLAAINPDSLEVLSDCKLEASLGEWPVGSTVQFERMGYFTTDLDSQDGALVFNRSMALRDTWAKIQAKG